MFAVVGNNNSGSMNNDKFEHNLKFSFWSL